MMLFELAVGKVCRNLNPEGWTGQRPAKEESNMARTEVPGLFETTVDRATAECNPIACRRVLSYEAYSYPPVILLGREVGE